MSVAQETAAVKQPMPGLYPPSNRLTTTEGRERDH